MSEALRMTSDRRKSEIKIISEGEKIGGGSIGSVDKVVIELPNGKQQSFVRKIFKEDFGSDSKEDARSIVNSYEALRSAGVKHIPTTFRLFGENTDQILITDYQQNGNVVFSANPNELVEIDAVNNIEQLIAELDSDLKRAAKQGITVLVDAYFLIGPKEGGELATPKVIIGDLDRISVDENFDYKEVYTQNVRGLWLGLMELLAPRMRHVPETYQKYWDYLENYAATAPQRLNKEGSS